MTEHVWVEGQWAVNPETGSRGRVLRGQGGELIVQFIEGERYVGGCVPCEPPEVPGAPLPPRADERMSCKRCGAVMSYDFDVPDIFWNHIVPDQYRNRVICAACFHIFSVRNPYQF